MRTAWLGAGLALFGLLAVLAAAPAPAVQPDEMLADTALEARARAIGKNLRCLVCQNQSIDDSDAGLARDLRILVRQRLTAGDSDAQVIDFVVARYGDFVLLNPPLKPVTYALWVGPAVIFGLAALSVVIYFRRPRKRPAPASAAALSAEERERLRRLLGAERPR
ncbi:MAG: cytochrome c-type biogenesis protein CcmH [Proteobacteria bacterium]|nr:cytochrome c-type biogenesis protein CcmH [Pseudomonadota bacterium]